VKLKMKKKIPYLAKGLFLDREIWRWRE
jgi:hypothetical protein